jgi:hypothetical protein
MHRGSFTDRYGKKHRHTGTQVQRETNVDMERYSSTLIRHRGMQEQSQVEGHTPMHQDVDGHSCGGTNIHHLEETHRETKHRYIPIERDPQIDTQSSRQKYRHMNTYPHKHKKMHVQRLVYCSYAHTDKL